MRNKQGKQQQSFQMEKTWDKRKRTDTLEVRIKMATYKNKKIQE